MLSNINDIKYSEAMSIGEPLKINSRDHQIVTFRILSIENIQDIIEGKLANPQVIAQGYKDIR